MRRDRPLVPEGVRHCPGAVAPEHVRHRHQRFGARRHGFIEQVVGVMYVEIEADRRRAHALRARAAPLRILLAQHENRIADLNLTVHELFAVRRHESAAFLGAEGFLIELHRLKAAADCQVRDSPCDSPAESVVLVVP